MIITIFGSCRQYSLKDNYQITSIQEKLTYPHYTKEIIQAIEYCKGISNISLKDSRHCFRTGILNNNEISYENFVDEYNKTDIFVIEIASRISYKYNSLYVHHIAKDHNYTGINIDNIEVRDLSDIEIESDLLEIKRLLYPKPFLVVSHISTRSTGKRYELICLLDILCKKHNITFYNPSILLERYNEDELFVKENVLSHYSPFGESVISNVYKELIDSYNIK